MSYYDQSAYRVRVEWGAAGVEVFAPISDTIVIVDVVVSHRVAALPYGWKTEQAETFAKRHNAILVGRRGQAELCLSPPSLSALESCARVVLPSPNGSTLTLLAAGHTRTLAGLLRNRTAVADYLNDVDGTVTVTICGERWPENNLRPAIEDQLGAGAIVQALTASNSPEAQAAEAVFS